MIPLLIGGFLGFFIAIMLEWVGYNVVFNVAEAFTIVIILYFVITFIFLILGMFLLWKKRGISGMCFFLAGFKLLNWILFWYLPLYLSGTWVSMSYWFWAI